MKVIIMRHGEASMNAPSDDARPLTQRGILQSQQVGAWLANEDQLPDYVWVSPYLRAQQTWQTIRAELSSEVTVKTCSDITPNGHAQKVAKMIHEFITEINQMQGNEESNFASSKTLMIVSHLPLVGYLVEELCVDEVAPMFGTSDLACVMIHANREGELIWQGGLLEQNL
ncbi:phosphohistidine phosphatase SixA [Thorsellia anophelis]|uniref:Phosphohistidine phosphatase, SixA n=1 Tax=Thorsellia anophelis DSM 18579 TaxID=1123402 RepID=A0A1I0EM37_9GAMM|nr:phosphohistidine phosphatase SixA [Thorsellia anophelis]SET45814.1 phosphohistidine phosphatase, SixA [Thorsellia anophelis DSM 18579]